MKKILCLILSATLLFASTSLVYAKPGKAGKNNNHEDKRTSWHQNNKFKPKKQGFKIKKSPVIKYGRYKLPTSPVTKGMGASLDYNKKSTELKVSKGNITIMIDFKNQIVTVNGIKDTKSDIFKTKDSKKMIVLMKYIAEIFGCGVDIDDDEIEVEAPGLDSPTEVFVTPVGNTVVANTLNTTNVYMTASARIKAGQATGGKAELYVGSNLVATDTSISATDTKVTFTTSDDTPTNAELRAKVPKGGEVTVRLYNADKKYVTSKKSNPTLSVDYSAPTIKNVKAATYDPVEGKLHLTVTDAGAIGDKVDVTKLSIYDTSLGKNYQLTNASNSGSSGVVKSTDALIITLGTSDKNVLSNFGKTTMHLTIANGSLLTDAAGNVSTKFDTVQTVPVTVKTGLSAPTKVTVTPVGTNIRNNTLNTSTLYLTATANIIAGQATGGKAELYIGSRLVATDPSINEYDTQVTFTTADQTPTNAELRTIVPEGGVATVKLYNSSNQTVVSTEDNPKIIVDYVAPTISEFTSAVYDMSEDKIYLIADKLSKVDDIVDVTKISIYDSVKGRFYQLTDQSKTGSTGKVYNSNSILIQLGSADKKGITIFGDSGIYVNVGVGSLLTDAAGNASENFTSTQTIELNVIP